MSWLVPSGGGSSGPLTLDRGVGNTYPPFLSPAMAASWSRPGAARRASSAAGAPSCSAHDGAVPERSPGGSARSFPGGCNQATSSPDRQLLRQARRLNVDAGRELAHRPSDLLDHHTGGVDPPASRTETNPPAQQQRRGINCRSIRPHSVGAWAFEPATDRKSPAKS
jgi:hypothetical protein